MKTLTTILPILIAAKKISLREVPGLITNSYIFGAVCGIIFLLIAILISNSIKYQGGTNPTDPKKRRVWFWIIGIISPVVFYMYNFILVIPNITKGPALDKFMLHGALSAILTLFVYILLGFILAKVLKRGKIGNWFPSKK